MLAIINFKNHIKGGVFARLLAYCFPKINVKFTYSETLCAKIIYVKPYVPLQSPLAMRRCLNKTFKILQTAGVNCFISAPGSYCDFLLSKGAKPVVSQDYFSLRTIDCIKKISALFDVPLEEIPVCVYDMKQTDWQKSLFTSLTRLCRQTVLIEPENESALNLAEDLFDKNGTACIVTDNLNAASNCGIAVSLSATEELIGSGTLPFGTVILSTDRSYLPAGEPPYTILTDIGVYLPDDLDMLLPDGVATGDFAGRLYSYYKHSKLLELGISSFYSFGRPVPEKNLAYCTKGIDRY